MLNPEKFHNIFLFFIAAFIFLHLFRLPFVPILLEGDQTIHLSNAWRMYQGETPFLDFFLFYIPGTEIFYFLLFLVFGVKIWILNLTIFFLFFGISAVCFFISRQLLDGWSAYFPTLIYLVLGFREFGSDGSHRLFSAFGVLLAVAVIFKSRSRLRLFSAGIVCGITSCFTQQRGLFGLAAIVLFLIIENFTQKINLSLFFRSIFFLITPYILIIGTVSLYIIYAAGWDTFYFSIFVFPLKHYPSDTWNKFASLLQDIPSHKNMTTYQFLRLSLSYLFYYLMTPLIYFFFFIVFWRKRGEINREKRSRLLLLAVLGVILTASVFPFPVALRFYQIAVPSLILFVWVMQKTILNENKINRLVFAGLLLLGIAFSVQRQMINVYFQKTPSGKVFSFAPESLDRFRWLSEHTQPGDNFYEAHHSNFYMLFQLKNPTPMPLIRPNNYTPPKQVEKVLHGLERNPPKYIIWNRAWNNPEIQNSAEFNLEPLVNFLYQNYRPAGNLFASRNARGAIEYEAEIWEKNE